MKKIIVLLAATCLLFAADASAQKKVFRDLKVTRSFEVATSPVQTGNILTAIDDNGTAEWLSYSYSVTKAQFDSLATDSLLTPNAIYKISNIENGLFIKALSSFEYSFNGKLSLMCPKTYKDTTIHGNVWKGIWRSTTTVDTNHLIIHGAQVWRNLTGSVGSSYDIITLDSVNWDLVPKNNFSNNEYTPLLLSCQYDFENNWVNFLSDHHNNVIGVDYELNQFYGFNYNPALSTDWNVMTKGVVFSNNNLFLVANNTNNVISNKTNGFIFDNDGGVFDNKYVSIISNNSGSVFENISSAYDISNSDNDVYFLNGSTFYFTHDFSATSLSSGDSLLFNLIPEGARIVSIKAIGNTTGAAGAELEFGLQGDEPDLLPAALLVTVNAGQVYNSFSEKASAQRAFQIKASGGNVTGGSINVVVELLIED